MTLTLRMLFLAMCLFVSSMVTAQISLPANTIVTESFNGIGSSATASIPVNWKMSAAGAGATSGYATGTNVTATTQAANSGLPSTGGRYNWATTAGTEHCIGFLTTAGYTASNSIMAYYRNTTGATVNSITVSFDVERYVVSTGTFSLSFSSSTDGNSWTAQAAGDIATGIFATGANAGTFTTPQSINRTITINISLANNADVYLRWVFTTTNANSQGLGLDNVSVFAGTATPVLTATLRDSLQVDNGVGGQFNEGDVIRYKAVIKNNGTGNANNVQITLPTPPVNTTMVAGSIKTSALAVDDNYTTSFNTVLNGTTVLANDAGIPAPTAIITYGSSNNPNISPGTATVSDAGAAITMQANGTFTYTPVTGFSGIDKFTYITGNGNLPNNDATVVITIAPDIIFTTTDVNPVCNGSSNGSITFNASGGNGALTYSISGSGGTYQSSNVFSGLPAGTYNLAVKDAGGYIKTATTTLSNPAAVVVNGTSPVNIIYNTAMTTVTFTRTNGTGASTWSATGLPSGISLNSSTGDVTGTPGVTGTFNATVNVADVNGCTGSKNIVVNVAPKLGGDSYTAVGNTQLVADGHSAPATPFTSSVTNILSNDVSDAAITVTAGTFATTNGGFITIAANGKFTYTPLNGSNTADSYVYTASSNGVSGTATISFTVSNMVWYVNNTYAGANGTANGSSHRPYTDLTAASTAAQASQVIYVHTGSGATAGNATLKASQTLRGAGNALTVGALTIAAGTKPTLSGTVTLANSVTADGFDMNTGATNALASSGATSVTVNINSITTAAAASPVSLTNTTGSVTISTGTLTGGAGAVVNISGGTVSFTYGGSASQATASQPLISISGGHNTGTVTFNTGTLSATNGTGLQFDNADGTYNFNGTNTLNGGDAGIDILNGSAGTFVFSAATTITNPTGTGFNIGAATVGSGSTCSVDYNGTISKNSAGRAIEIQQKTGGTVSFDGTVSSTVSGTGINLATNTGATISFTNTLTLNTGTSAAFSATGGGTVNVTGSSNSITTTSGTGINWNGVTGTSTELFNNVTSTSGNAVVIAGSGATAFTFNDITSTTGTAVNISTATGAFSFHKISSNGASKGIIVSGLTGSGSFTVTGTGGSGLCDATHVGVGDCGGGSILNSTNRGAEFTNANNITLKNMYFKGNGVTAIACVDDVASGSNTTCNAAIHLTSSSGVILDHIYVDGTGSNDMGILGNAVSGLTITNVEVANFNNIAKVPVDLQNLSGTCPFTSLNVHNNNSIHTVFITQNTGTSNITLTSPVIQNGGGANNPDGLQVNAYSSANVTVNATNVTVNNLPGNGVMYQANSGSTLNGTLNGGTVTGTNGILMQSAGDNTHFTYNVTNLSNVSTHNLGSNAITVGKANGAGTATTTGSVTNNVITSATCGGGCAGIKVASFGVGGASTANITGNNISGVDAQGIWVVGGQGASSLTATIQNNNLHNPVAGNTSYAIDVYPGTQAGDAVCFALNLGDMSVGHTVAGNRNLITGTWQSGGNPIEVGIFNNSLFKLLNYPNPNTNDANAAAWVKASNGGLNTDAFHIGTNQFTAGSACPLKVGKRGARSKVLTKTSSNISYSLLQEQLQSAIDEALMIWQNLGLSDDQMKLLRQIQFSIGKTMPGELGSKFEQSIIISHNADGNGWYTGNEDARIPAGQIDLLSCILHEMGHALGLKDLKGKMNRNNFMYAYLTAGERKFPSAKTVKIIKGL